MKPLDVAASRTAEGIEEDILDYLGIELLPVELTDAINNRLNQFTRDTKDLVRSRAGTELSSIFDRAFGA